MLVRIVKLTFKKENIASFMQIFEETKAGIRDFKGCQSVYLYQDISDPTVFFTHSIWDSEDDLERYRASSFFREVWARTRSLHSEKALAWSLNKVTD